MRDPNTSDHLKEVTRIDANELKELKEIYITRIDRDLEDLRKVVMRERDLKKIDEKEIAGAKVVYYMVEVGDGEIELIVRMHPPKNFDKDLLKLFLISEIFPYEITKIYDEMGETTAPNIIQFSKKTSSELLEIEKGKIENKIRKAFESMVHPKKKLLLKAAKKKLDELRKDPQKNKREIDLLVMKINELIFYM